MTTKVIYINGGTGFIGRALCDQWLKMAGDGSAAGAEEIRIYVQTRMPGHHRHTGVQFVRAYNELPEGVIPEVVVNLAGAPIADERWTEARKRLLLSSRVEVTKSLFDAVQARGDQPKVLINASAVGFYGVSEAKHLTESDPKGDGFAADLCAQWEEAAQQFSTLGTRVCCLRIGVVLGAGGGVLGKLLPIYKLGLGGPIGNGVQGFSWIHLADVLGLIMTAAIDPRYRGAVNATAPNPVRQREFASMLAKALFRPGCLPTPTFALRLAYGEMADELLIGGQFVVPAVAVELGYPFKFTALDGAIKHVLQ